jgi:predicted DNA-binding protein YlxM (UPF0122 family)
MWQEMIQDLRDHHLKFREIAAELEISNGAVHDLLTGRSSQPTGNVALKLIALHKKVMRRKIPED